jgi:NADPH-dependent 2,4-dienoyl-CoA reductase/sulfur reductase-like enzyme/nitrite reductase/ring-hydroxylating ferredoxin subunit
MAGGEASAAGPDLQAGIALANLNEGSPLLGHVGEEPVILVRRGNEVFALGATCTHYSGPLAEGLIIGETVRCPWHHACFHLRTGKAVRPPALNPIPCWRVEHQGEMVYVREKLPSSPRPVRALSPDLPQSVVIIGGGAAGNAAAETLRNEGYSGPITLLSADDAAPYDRPNLSKDYLAGTAPEEWIPLRGESFYAEQNITLRLGTQAAAIDPAQRVVRLASGETLSYGALLLATGAEPIRLNVPGASLAHVHLLRSLADSRALIAAASTARRCLVVGASFIGLEVAASLRARNIEVHVVAPEAHPMERIMGPELGAMIQALHTEHGVRFHLGATVAMIASDHVVLSTGERIDADLVVVGIGVRPATALAEQAGLAMDRGVVVDAYLQTSAPGVYAAGDIARWPDPRSGQAIRVEHWVVAERQGQVAARNMLGSKERFDAVPFFWSQHYDTTISYVGHAEAWDRIELDGSVKAQSCAARFWRAGRLLAVATVGRDRESLKAEAAFEAEIAA